MKDLEALVCEVVNAAELLYAQCDDFIGVSSDRAEKLTGREDFILYPTESRDTTMYALGLVIDTTRKLKRRFYGAVEGKADRCPSCGSSGEPSRPCCGAKGIDGGFG